MSILERLHGSFVVGRRASTLADHLAEQLPDIGSVLDVGCGDGYLASLLSRRKPGLTIAGVDVLIRENLWIPVEEYDGSQLPYADDSFDTVLLVDVIHHLTDPMALLREASRVARRSVIIKDHRCDTPLAARTLRFMDQIGNRRFGVALTYDYWSFSQWQEAFRELRWEVEAWNGRLGLYPFPFNLVFDRDLHFIAKLAINSSARIEPRRDEPVFAARGEQLVAAETTEQ